MKETSIYRIEVIWDDEVSVWIATSEDIPGLVTEADTMESLVKKLRTMIPELLIANRLISSEQPLKVSFEIISRRLELVNVDS